MKAAHHRRYYAAHQSHYKSSLPCIACFFVFTETDDGVFLGQVDLNDKLHESKDHFVYFH